MEKINVGFLLLKFCEYWKSIAPIELLTVEFCSARYFFNNRNLKHP